MLPEEAEEAIIGNPLDGGFEVVDGKERWAYVGETSDGRILRVAITVRGKRMWVVTAFEAPKCGVRAERRGCVVLIAT